MKKAMIILTACIFFLSSCTANNNVSSYSFHERLARRKKLAKSSPSLLLAQNELPEISGDDESSQDSDMTIVAPEEATMVEPEQSIAEQEPAVESESDLPENQDDQPSEQYQTTGEETISTEYQSEETQPAESFSPPEEPSAITSEENTPQEETTSSTQNNEFSDIAPLERSNEPSADSEPAIQEERNEPQIQIVSEEISSNFAEDNKLLLNFENIDLSNFIREIANLKKINFIYDPQMLEGQKVSLGMHNPVTLDEAWDYLQTVLRLAQFALVKVGSSYKLVALADVTNQPLTFIGTNPDLLPESDETVRYIAIMQNLRVTDKSLEDLVKNMLSTKAMLMVQEDSNAFIIADSSYNIKMAVSVLNAIDQNGQAEVVSKIQLKEAYALEVKNIIDTLTGASNEEAYPLAHLLRKKEEQSSAYFPRNLRVVADQRSNSLILLGTQDAIQKIEEFIKNEIDTSVADHSEIESPLHVYELQYADATQMAKFLTDALKTKGNKDASTYGYVLGGTKYFRDTLTITPDVAGNRLLISSIDRNDWKLIKETLKNLDTEQPQVAIEALLVDVTLIDNKQLGGQMRNKKNGMIGRNIDVQTTPINKTVFQTDAYGNPVSLLGDLIQGLVGGLGQTMLTFGCDSNIWAIFQMLRSITNATIIAQPFLSVANKYKANVLVGDMRQVIQSTALATGGQLVQGYQQVSADLSLTVTPQINIDGVINLEIDLSRTIFTDPSGLNTSTQDLTSSVSIADGQILVLGGFVRNQVTETLAKVPVIGDIPLIGWMFKQKVKVREKRTVLMFLRPTIIKPRTKPGANPYTQMKIDEAKEWVNLTVSQETPDPIHNWFFNPSDAQYSYKVDDFAQARYQPTTVNIKYDPYYRAEPLTRSVKKKKLNTSNVQKNTSKLNNAEMA